MNVTAKMTCTCGDVLSLSLPMKLDTFSKVLSAWARDHVGPGHTLQREGKPA